MIAAKGHLVRYADRRRVLVCGVLFLRRPSIKESIFWTVLSVGSPFAFSSALAVVSSSSW